MRASISNLALVMSVLACPLPAGSGAAAETLRLSGTGGIVEAMRQVAPQFTAATGVEVEIVAGLGTSGAMRALADGAIDAVFAAREFTPDEARTPLVSDAFARTPLVFVTSHRKPNGLKSGDIAPIFAAENPKWEDGTPLKIILRTKVDADTMIVERTFAAMKEAFERARQRPEVPLAATDQDNVNIAQRLAGSFTFAGYGQIMAEKCDLRFVPVDGVAPSPATLADGTYPYEKMFYLVYAKDRSAGAEQFLQFLRSAETRAMLQAIGYLPVAG
jgi:phosphate transport system substrate-binding protein